MSAAREAALAALAARAGDPLALWLRDDDATAPSPALDRLLALCGGAGVTPLLAVIPAPWDGPPAGPALMRRLAAGPPVELAQHGFSHRNHAGPGEKKQELGPHRPAAAVLSDLARGRARLGALCGDALLPLLVPPWNRIAPAVVAGLPALGFAALSTFGPERPAAGLRVLNSRLDIMDWRLRAGRPAEELWAAVGAAAAAGEAALGLLTHHLVHDAAAWAFLTDVLPATAASPGARWTTAGGLLWPEAAGRAMRPGR